MSEIYDADTGATDEQKQRGNKLGNMMISRMGPTEMIQALDAADREQGIHRVKVDDDTVYAATLEIAKHHRLDPMTSKDRCTCGHVTPLGRFFSSHVARAVLAVLTGSES